MNLDPEKCMLIQVIPKRPSFANARNWKPWDFEKKEGSRISLEKIREVASSSEISMVDMLKAMISKMINEYNKEIIIIDDLVYVMTQSFMSNIDNKGLTYSPIAA